MGNESLILSVCGVLLGLVAWAFSRIVDRATADADARHKEFVEHRSNTESRFQKIDLAFNDYDHRIRSLEKAGPNRRSQKEE